MRMRETPGLLSALIQRKEIKKKGDLLNAGITGRLAM